MATTLNQTSKQLVDGELRIPKQHKLPPEIKAKWVAALRSGDYKQGTSQLKRELSDGTAEFCCLGVLADICTTGPAYWRNAGYMSDKLVQDCGLPPAWQEDSSRDYSDTHPQRLLAYLNDVRTYDTDDEGEPMANHNTYTFNDMADIIEKYY